MSLSLWFREHRSSSRESSMNGHPSDGTFINGIIISLHDPRAWPVIKPIKMVIALNISLVKNPLVYLFIGVSF